MNYNRPPHMREGARFVSGERKKAVANQNAERRELLPKRAYVSLHENYREPGFPEAHYLREWFEDFYREHGELADTLLYPSATRTRRVLFCVNRGIIVVQKLPLWAPVTLEVVQSEYFRLERRSHA